MNIEDCFWFDPRLRALQKEIGDYEALGQILAFWRLAQEQFKLGKKISEEQFRIAGLSNALIECEWAVRDQEGIYAKGSKRHFDWLLKKQDAGRKGGQVSAKHRLKKIQNQENQTLKSSKSKHFQPSSSSSSSNNKETTLDQTAFDRVYELYPRKIGKKTGLTRLKRQIKTPKDLTRFERAVKNYCKFCLDQKTETQFIKYFSTFANCWEDWVDPASPTKAKGFDFVKGRDIEL